MAMNSKTCICMCFFLSFLIICRQNYLVSYHQGLSGHFHLCIYLLNKHICFEICSLLSYSHRRKLAKMRLVVVFLEFSEGDSDKYFEFSTLLRSPDESIMPRNVEITDEIDLCGKHLKTRFETVILFFNCLQKLIKNFLIRRKIRRFYPDVLFVITLDPNFDLQ